MRLLTAAGLDPAAALAPLAGGGNNQVFRVGDAVLKAYYHHPDDPRDRLGNEYGFLSFAWRQGVRCVPRPLGCDAEAHLALYEFIPGRKLALAEIGREAVDQAIAFLREVNAARTHPDARQLPAASEACFSLADHLHCLQKRLDRVRQLGGGLEIDQAAARFVRDRLLPAGERVAQAVRSQGRGLGYPLDEPLPVDGRCLSPSDFGFHNAVLAADGRLRFIDFEYAGWDDPAKLISDFFSQPDCPVPMAYYDDFAAALPGGAEALRPRARLLLPVYRLKWCCIVLNEFLPLGGNRRRFARGAGDELAVKARQLAKAAAGLDRILDGGGAAAAA
jgi:hypothetical protein